MRYYSELIARWKLNGHIITANSTFLTLIKFSSFSSCNSKCFQLLTHQNKYMNTYLAINTASQPWKHNTNFHSTTFPHFSRFCLLIRYNILETTWEHEIQTKLITRTSAFIHWLSSSNYKINTVTYLPVQRNANAWATHQTDRGHNDRTENNHTCSLKKQNRSRWGLQNESKTLILPSKNMITKSQSYKK